ncbi:hypothetical protein FGE05_10880 [Pseudomonas sp. ICMP22404]|uniref:hypothetical protein n=1 Tax=unclassified Pseudomonas TaxID=196821 RepID=UPI00111A53FB|nr:MULTISPECIES: hypothetical protein [unclassified Pseudomonas]MXR31992.1 hypothetical protein [Pseudomonas sp. PICF6]TNF82806.1 hypothetical protein FGE05_10880 [Pseudomonas sp. ICMP22404]
MNAEHTAPGYKQIADEAVFQLDCASEFADWMFALMTAIRDDHKHGGGQNAPGLASLGIYLAESHQPDAHRILELLNSHLAAAGGAA